MECVRGMKRPKCPSGDLYEDVDDIQKLERRERELRHERLNNHHYHHFLHLALLEDVSEMQHHTIGCVCVCGS